MNKPKLGLPAIAFPNRKIGDPFPTFPVTFLILREFGIGI
jgi:hypothetical protein